MAPRQHTAAHTRKTVTTPAPRASVHRVTKARMRTCSSSDPPPSSSSSSTTLPLWEQVRALELANATMALESAALRDRIASLNHKLDQRRHYTSVIQGDQMRALENKVALEKQLVDARAAAAAERRARDDEMRTLRAQLAHDKLESRIHRCAAQVAYQTLTGPAERDMLLRILKRCRRAFTDSDAPPPPRPPSPEPALQPELKPEDDADDDDDGDENEDWVLRTPSKRQGNMPRTPVSMPRVSLFGSTAPGVCREDSTPRREGLRPRRNNAGSNGSPC
ncbi:hypothetical protein IF1G_03529 [Cordyceps javanica]|uniref:Uncharacterized protein n=1 Tax=Cordyceps javanica TaxID=43265 RepID=A0A545V7U0_9HYPO|nr:hypothetical protein IF1G_03529 [Cordyceps javanica]TQW09038.1 hypothetical protein IF2G_03469 [Cordyceps javanica]